MNTSTLAFYAPIRVSEEDVAELREVGEQALLVWREDADQVDVYPPTGTLPEDARIIATGVTLAVIEEGYGHPVSNDLAAKELAYHAEDTRSQWRLVRALTPALTPIRRRLERQGIYLAGAPACAPDAEGGPAITDTYAHPDSPLTARLTLTPGYTSPVEIRVGTADHQRTITLGIAGDTTHRALAGLITATVTAALAHETD